MTEKFERYIEALRDDMPSPHDELRLRQRVASVGIAVTATVVTKTAVGATGVGKIGLLPALLARMANLPLLTQLGLVAAGTAAVATGPVVVAQQLLSKPTTQVVDSAGSAKPGRVDPPHRTSMRVDQQADAERFGMAAGTLDMTLGTPNSGEPPVTRATESDLAYRTNASASAVAPAGTVPARSLADSTRRGVGRLATRIDTATQPVGDPTTGTPSQVIVAGDLSQLAEETRLIDAALLSIRQGNLTNANRLLNEHAVRFPSAKLAKERERAIQKLEAASGESLH